MKRMPLQLDTRTMASRLLFFLLIACGAAVPDYDEMLNLNTTECDNFLSDNVYLEGRDADCSNSMNMFSVGNGMAIKSSLSKIFLYEGEDLFLRLEPQVNMTSCVFMDTRSQLTVQLLPPEKNPDYPEVQYWGGGLKSHECGVRITNINNKYNNSGWILLAKENMTTLDQGVVVITVHVLYEEDDDEIFEEYILMGKSYSLILRPENLVDTDLYCTVKHPLSGDEVTLYDNDCIYEVSPVTTYDNGLWASRIGMKGLTQEFEYNKYLVVQEEELDAGWEYSTSSYPGAVNLYCNLIDTTKDLTSTYCRFIPPYDQVGFHMSDGLGNGKYSYFGNGIKNLECGLTIENPGTEDMGVWQCILGSQSSYSASYIPFFPSRMYLAADLQDNLQQQDMDVIMGSEITVKCTATVRLHYCLIIAPDGSQYPGEKLTLGVGKCMVTIKSVNETHNGMWFCQMGALGGGSEIAASVNVTVRNSTLMAIDEEVIATIGAKAMLSCKSVQKGSVSTSILLNAAPVSPSLSYCRFIQPDGTSLTLNTTSGLVMLQRFQYNGKGLAYGECGIQIDPVSVQDSGEWKCVALMDGEQEESLVTITLHVTGSTEVFPSSAMVQVGEEVILRLRRRYQNQTSCSVEMPDGRTVDLSAPGNNPVSYWGMGVKFGECGVKIKSMALQTPTNGYQMWTLISNNSQSLSTRAVAWVAVEDPVSTTVQQSPSKKLMVDLGREFTLNCSKPYSQYCLIVSPGDNFEHYTPGPCSKTLDSVSSIHLGTWTCYIGLSTTTQELVETVELVARSTKLSTDWNVTSHGMELLCHIDYPLEYCRFVDPRWVGVRLSDGLADGRLSYTGHGLHTGECGLSIVPVQDEDYGVWMCFVGVSTSEGLEHQVGYITLSKEQQRKEIDISSSVKATSDVKAVAGSELTVQCKTQSSLAYCWLLHPNGTQLVPVPGSYKYSGAALQMGVCSISLVQAQAEDSGQWNCHMGTQGSMGKELVTKINVIITSTSLHATQANVVAGSDNSTTITCQTVPDGVELVYCRFLRPDGKGITLNQRMSGLVFGRYRYYGDGLENGHCGLIMHKVESEDYGKWICAALPRGRSEEAADVINVEPLDFASIDNMIWMVGVGVAILLVVIGAASIWVMRRRAETLRITRNAMQSTVPRASAAPSEASSTSSNDVVEQQEEPVIVTNSS